MSELTYLIAGANHGIGKGPLEAFVLRSDTTLIDAVRDVEKSTQTLNTVMTGKNSQIMVVKRDSTPDTKSAAMTKELKSKHGITKIDVVIYNAGIMGVVAPCLQTPPQEVRNQLEVNTSGQLSLIQAFFPL